MQFARLPYFYLRLLTLHKAYAVASGAVSISDGLKVGTNGPFITTCGHRRSQRDKPFTRLSSENPTQTYQTFV
jgi:hypothetical protein